jgi:hypothetical protein
MEKKVPATQAEQVAIDVAPVTAEYVPAKESHEEYSKASQKAKIWRREHVFHSKNPR